MTVTTYAAAEAVVRTWLASRFPASRVVTELPADLEGALSSAPLYRVTRVGGSDDSYYLDTARIDVEAFAKNVSDARAAAEAVRTALRFEAQGATAAGGAIASVETNVAPRSIPYDNPAVRRVTGTYLVTVSTITT